MNHHQEGHAAAPDGTRLWQERDVPDGARASVVLVHGYGDHLGRYRNFRDAMLADRLAVHAYDVRGPRPERRARAAGCKAFSDYTDELGAFVASTLAALPRAAALRGGPQPRGADHPELAPRPPRRGPRPSADWSVARRISRLAFTPPAWKTAPAQLLSRPGPGLRHPHRAQPRPTSAATRPPSGPPTPTRSTGERPRPAGTPRPPPAQQRVLASGPAIRLPILVMVGSDDPVASAP